MKINGITIAATGGATGPSGSSGTSGLAGTSGTSGINGTSGTSGLNGSSGTSGLAGTSGTSGLNGSSGTSGLAGTSGTSGTSSTGVFGSYSVSGSVNQDLSSITNIRLSLSGDTSYNYGTASTNKSYFYIVEAGSNKFNLGTASNFKVSASDFPTIGVTGSGLTGSFILRGLYDGSSMWIKSETGYFDMPKSGLALGNRLALDTGNLSSYSGSGSAWYDLSGNNNTTILYNTPSYSSSNGGFLTFNGSTQYGSATSSSSLNIPGTSITTEVWFKISSWAFGSYNFPLSKSPASGAGGNYGIFLRNTGGLSKIGIFSKNVVEQFWGNDSIAAGSGLSYTFTIGQWYQLALVQNGTNWYIYINGALFQSGTTAVSMITTADDLFIGKRPDGVFFGGSLSIINVFDYAVSGSQILTNFNLYKSRYGL